MAEQQDPTSSETNGGGDDQQPQVATIAQYVKDLSVENPNSPAVYQWPPAQPQLDVQFHINVNRVGDEVHEVALKIEASAKTDQGTHFVVDLTYAGLFGLRNFPEEALGPFLLAEAPRLMFPSARAIVASAAELIGTMEHPLNRPRFDARLGRATQDCGFPPLLLDPIDFTAAYMAQSGQIEQGTGQPGSEPTIQ